MTIVVSDDRTMVIVEVCLPPRPPSGTSHAGVRSSELCHVSCLRLRAEGREPHPVSVVAGRGRADQAYHP